MRCSAEAAPTCQIFPPTFPGYVPYCPYTDHPDGTWTAPDLAKARELVDASGTVGSRLTVWTARTPIVAGCPTRDISCISWTVSAMTPSSRLLQRRYIGTLFDPSPHSADRPSAWPSDYPAESGFLLPLVACDGAQSRQFCDPEIDARMEKAARLRPPTLTEPRALVRRSSTTSSTKPPWVPLVNPIWTGAGVRAARQLPVPSLLGAAVRSDVGALSGPTHVRVEPRW